MSAELQINTLRIDGTELLDAMVTSVFLLDQDLRVTYLNAAAQSLLGLGPNQALGRSIAELTRGAESLLPMFERARTGGEGVVQSELAWPGPAAPEAAGGAVGRQPLDGSSAGARNQKSSRRRARGGAAAGTGTAGSST